jgi:hypothetical protein
MISLTQLLTLAAEAHIIPVLCNDTSGILAYGRTRRTATTGQRHALTARDRGCSFPACTKLLSGIPNADDRGGWRQ